MRTYHTIHWVETVLWHNIFIDKRFWVGIAIVGFIALFTLLVIYSAKTGGTSTMPYYYGPWPYGPSMPYGPVSPR